ncbi:MAG: glycosyltransferase family 39 protein [Parvularculaceae bacterium]
MATDAPLLFFWSAGLYLLARIMTSDKTNVAEFAMLGAAIGLGMLSKYAMIYFPAMIIALASAPFREKLLKPPSFCCLLIALAHSAPNMIWNSQHDFQTLSHTAANAKMGRFAVPNR